MLMKYSKAAGAAIPGQADARVPNRTGGLMEGLLPVLYKVWKGTYAARVSALILG